MRPTFLRFLSIATLAHLAACCLVTPTPAQTPDPPAAPRTIEPKCVGWKSEGLFSKHVVNANSASGTEHMMVVTSPLRARWNDLLLVEVFRGAERTHRFPVARQDVDASDYPMCALSPSGSLCAISLGGRVHVLNSEGRAVKSIYHARANGLEFLPDESALLAGETLVNLNDGTTRHLGGGEWNLKWFLFFDPATSQPVFFASREGATGDRVAWFDTTLGTCKREFTISHVWEKSYGPDYILTACGGRCVVLPDSPRRNVCVVDANDGKVLRKIRIEKLYLTAHMVAINECALLNDDLSVDVYDIANGQLTRSSPPATKKDMSKYGSMWSGPSFVSTKVVKIAYVLNAEYDPTPLPGYGVRLASRLWYLDGESGRATPRENWGIPISVHSTSKKDELVVFALSSNDVPVLRLKQTAGLGVPTVTALKCEEKAGQGGNPTKQGDSLYQGWRDVSVLPNGDTIALSERYVVKWRSGEAIASQRRSLSIGGTDVRLIDGAIARWTSTIAGCVLPEGEIAVWNAEGQNARVIGNGDKVFEDSVMTLSDDGQFVALIGYEGTWIFGRAGDGKDGARVREEGVRGVFFGKGEAGFSAESKYFAHIPSLTVVDVLKLSNLEVARRIELDTEREPTVVEWAAKKQVVAIGCTNGDVLFADIEDPNKDTVIKGEGMPVIGLSWSHDEATLVAHFLDNTVKQWFLAE